VATSALGMGYDKPDLAFCVHLGLPPTPVAYYQQIGRAGRAIDRAVVVAVPRPVEDERIWRWFDSVSLPSEAICNEVLSQLDTRSAMSLTRLEANVNMGRSRLTTLLSILDVQGAIRKVKGGWVRSSDDWTYDAELAERLRALRSEEAEQMRRYVDHPGCRLRYLRELLDDAEAEDCGRCDRCTDGIGFVPPSPARAAEAQALLRGADIGIEPRRQWAPGLDEPKGRISPERQAQWGRALARLGDGARHRRRGLPIRTGKQCVSAGQRVGAALARPGGTARLGRASRSGAAGGRQRRQPVDAHRGGASVG